MEQRRMTWTVVAVSLAVLILVLLVATWTARGPAAVPAALANANYSTWIALLACFVGTGAAVASARSLRRSASEGALFAFGLAIACLTFSAALLLF